MEFLGRRDEGDGEGVDAVAGPAMQPTAALEGELLALRFR
jgi:hypothetical protein